MLEKSKSNSKSNSKATSRCDIKGLAAEGAEAKKQSAPDTNENRPDDEGEKKKPQGEK